MESSNEIQIHKLKQFSEEQRQQLVKMAQFHDRLQRAAAEMNTLGFSTALLSRTEIDVLSQHLSQIPADLSGIQSSASSPQRRRSKRVRTDQLSTIQRTPLVSLNSHSNVTPITIKSKRIKHISGSSTQDEEDEGHALAEPSLPAGSDYGDLTLSDCFP